jgi:hypothetical protein
MAAVAGADSTKGAIGPLWCGWVGWIVAVITTGAVAGVERGRSVGSRLRAERKKACKEEGVRPERVPGRWNPLCCRGSARSAEQEADNQANPC